MVEQFGYLGCGANLLERITRVTQAGPDNIREKFEPSNRVVKIIEQPSRTVQQALEIKGLINSPALKGFKVHYCSLDKLLKFSRLSSKLQLLPRLESNLKNFRTSPLSKPRQNQVNPPALRQAPTLPQKELAQGCLPTVKRKPTFRSHAKEQKRVLIAIYGHLKTSQEQFIEWQPSAWFGEGDISSSDRAKWSNTLRSIINKGLVKLHVSNNRKLTQNRGNAKVCISLTPEGYQTAKQLMQND